LYSRSVVSILFNNNYNCFSNYSTKRFEFPAFIGRSGSQLPESESDR
jgi:hypothetical protein